MAGFSGCYKGIFPAVADIAAIMRYHDAKTIGDPRSTWGRLDGNPTQAIIRRNGARRPPGFMHHPHPEPCPAHPPLLLRRAGTRPRRGLRLLEGNGHGRVPA